MFVYACVCVGVKLCGKYDLLLRISILKGSKEWQQIWTLFVNFFNRIEQERELFLKFWNGQFFNG